MSDVVQCSPQAHRHHCNDENKTKNHIRAHLLHFIVSIRSRCRWWSNYNNNSTVWSIKYSTRNEFGSQNVWSLVLSFHLVAVAITVAIAINFIYVAEFYNLDTFVFIFVIALCTNSFLIFCLHSHKSCESIPVPNKKNETDHDTYL